MQRGDATFPPKTMRPSTPRLSKRSSPMCRGSSPTLTFQGAGSRAAGLTMAFKLLQAAQGTWRRLDAHDLLPLVRAGVTFQDGQQMCSLCHADFG